MDAGADAIIIETQTSLEELLLGIQAAKEAGAPCVVRTGITGPLTVRLRTGREPHWKVLPNGDVEIDLRRGQEALILPKGSRPDLTIAPVPVAIPGAPWGLP